jgi:hypothetical protein
MGCHRIVTIIGLQDKRRGLIPVVFLQIRGYIFCFFDDFKGFRKDLRLRLIDDSFTKRHQ